MKAWPYMPGVPAAGHITAGGYWHPGGIDNCTKCADPPRKEPPRDDHPAGPRPRA